MTSYSPSLLRRQTMKSLLTPLVLGVALAAPVSAQTAKPMPIDQLAAYNKPDREKVLYAGAKSEGKITWYTSLAGESYKQLAAAFEAKYPGIRVESYRATQRVACTIRRREMCT